jgi:hypothetical protein
MMSGNMGHHRMDMAEHPGMLYSLGWSALPICAIDDNKRVERYQKDAEGMVLFVSPHSCLHIHEYIS